LIVSIAQLPFVPVVGINNQLGKTVVKGNDAYEPKKQDFATGWVGLG
jgi:hypothetical protein